MSPAGVKLIAQVGADPNIRAAALLQDMAILQSSERSRFGYTRAARAIAGAIDRSVAELIADGTLRDVPFVGRSSERIIREVVETGGSETVDAAMATSGSRAEVLKRRGFRHGYLSRHALRLAFNARLPAAIVSTNTYAGDLQMHSTWSDGAEAIETLAEGAIALGWRRIGVTDHSYGLPIARGMSMASAAAQHEEIDAINARLAGQLRVYKGVEANILADGQLDLQADERAVFDYVIASPHSLLRKTTDQTPRMLQAVRLQGIALLGHPMGRMYNNRPGVAANWEKVFREAAKHDVAIEIDGNWYRQDVHYELASLALDCGCLFGLDSDAHSIAEFPFTDYAIAQARVAGIPSDRVVNCWDVQTFEAWLAARRKS